MCSDKILTMIAKRLNVQLLFHKSHSCASNTSFIFMRVCIIVLFLNVDKTISHKSSNSLTNNNMNIH